MERSHRGSQGEGAPEAACDPQPSESYGPGDSSEASCPSTSEVRREQVRRPGASSHPGGTFPLVQSGPYPLGTCEETQNKTLA